MFESVKTAFDILFSFWWLYLPILLSLSLIYGYADYNRQKYIQEIKWIILELSLPPDVKKSPKIAENVFSGLHGTYGIPLSWKKKFFGGKVPDWFSLEIVGNSGDIRFLIRTPEELRNFVEAAIFAQYPDAEIKLADDYVNQLPFLPHEDYDMFGTELIFTKKDAYPIKTYPSFEEESGKDEFRRTDPLTPLLELLSILGPNEHLWLQLVVRPTGNGWVKEAQEVVDEIVGKKAKAKATGLQKTVELIDSFVPGGGGQAAKDEKAEFNVQRLTPGQRYALEQVENKISKLGFKAGYRLIYAARKDVFNKSRVPTVIGMFKQLYSNNLNTFKPNIDTLTSHAGYLAWLFPSEKGFMSEPKTEEKKRRLFRAYIERRFVRKVIVLNTEELATLFHLPGIGVKTPMLPRVDAVKGQPPAALPTK